MKSEMKRWRVRWRDEKFFLGPNIRQSKSGVKNFSLYWGGGGGGFPQKSCSKWAETCFAFGIFEIRDNFWDAMNFVSEMKRWRVRWRDEEWDEEMNKFFFGPNIRWSKSGIKNFSLYWGGGGGGGSLKKKLLKMSWNMFCFWNFWDPREFLRSNEFCVSCLQTDRQTHTQTQAIVTR